MTHRVQTQTPTKPATTGLVIPAKPSPMLREMEAFGDWVTYLRLAMKAGRK